MVIQNVNIKNFKGIEEKIIEFKPGFNLIKGVNGKGKTSILEAIAVGLGGFIAGLSDVNTRHFSVDEICTVYTTVGDGSISKKHFVPVEVSMNVDLYGEQIAWTTGIQVCNSWINDGTEIYLVDSSGHLVKKYDGI